MRKGKFFKGKRTAGPAASTCAEAAADKFAGKQDHRFS